MGAFWVTFVYAGAARLNARELLVFFYTPLQRISVAWELSATLCTPVQLISVEWELYDVVYASTAYIG